ncbi:unnamed protein product [Musa banksii]
MALKPSLDAYAAFIHRLHLRPPPPRSPDLPPPPLHGLTFAVKDMHIRHQWLRHRVRQPGLGDDARGSVVHISRCSRCYRSWRHMRGQNCHGRDGIQHQW